MSGIRTNVGDLFPEYMLSSLSTAVPFASANFTDNDAGAGGSEKVEETPEFRNIRTIMENLLQTTLNRDEDDTAKKPIQQYKNDIKKLLCIENLSLFEAFLKPVEQTETYNKLLQITDQLSHDTFNTYSNGLFEHVNIDLSGSDNDLHEEIGLDANVLSDVLVKLNKTYKSSLCDLFESDTNIRNALNIVENLTKKVNIITELELNAASEDLLKSTARYIHATMQDINLFALFNKFITARKKFATCRKLLQVHKVVTDVESEPICTICMSEPIKQVSIPCGHSFCNNCISKQFSCYICRCKIEKKYKLFMN